jgi:hypothetical protein
MERDWNWPEYATKPQVKPPKTREEIEAAVAKILAKRNPQPAVTAPPQAPIDQPDPAVPKPTGEPVQPPGRGDRPTLRTPSRSSSKTRGSNPKETMYLEVYKTTKDLNRDCLGHRCRFWHNASDRRRKTSKYGYLPEMCPVADDCPLKEECIFAHNAAEFEFHPHRYKTIQCQGPRCPEDIHCPYLHQGEIVRPIKAKQAEAESALAKINSMLPAESSAPARDVFTCKLESQVTALKQKLYCQLCCSSVVKAFWVPCNHAVCCVCARSGVCSIDGSTQQHRLILE